MTEERIRDVVPLAIATRGGVVDNVYRGAAVAVRDTGEALLSYGDADLPAYIRSAAKPLQCIPVVACGAADAFGFDAADLAIVSASHTGGSEQVAQVRSILDRIGLPEGALRSGTGIADNCSGKHAGMLAACVHQGLPVETYTDPAHPHQQAILTTLARIVDLPPERIQTGVDGCSAPIHYLPVRHMALGFARLSVARRHFEPPVADAARRIFDAMWENPHGHTGEPAYREALGGAVKTRFVTKRGGNGVACAAVPGAGIGIAVKLESGAAEPLTPLVLRILRRLDVLSDASLEALEERFRPPIRNRAGAAVGEIRVLVP